MHKLLVACCLAGGLAVYAQTPTVSAVANAASFSSIVSPGAVVAILGSGFGEVLSDTKVMVGGLDAPVFFVSNNQINVQFPFNLPVGRTTLAVTLKGKLSEAATVDVSPFAPAVFTMDGRGAGFGVFASGQGLVIATSGVVVGERITAYAIGLGPTNPAVPAGTQAPLTPAALCTTIPIVTVGKAAAIVESAVLAPGLVGVYQVNFFVPDVPPGDQSVVISIAGVDSPAVLLPVGSATPTAIIRDTSGFVRMITGATGIANGGATIQSAAGGLMKTGQTLGASPSRNSAGPTVSNLAGAPSLELSPVGNSLGQIGTSLMPTGTTPNSSAPPLMTTSVSSGISYTCDATINAVSGVCTALNSTIAGLYGSTFTNATTSIYIKFGSTGLGQSQWPVNLVSYSAFRTALIAAETNSNDATAVTSSVPSTSPFGTDSVMLTNANARVLGLSASFGIMSDGATFCASGTAGCYDGIITVSSAQQSGGHLFFRSGSITSGQFDFFTVVEHETDEVLGTASCAFGCTFSGGTVVARAPADLFRYHSDHTRSSTAGGNSSCSSSNTTNACFSIDGVAMLQQYNNINNGQDAGDWATTCSHVQDAVGCPGLANLDISPAVEILVLDVVGYTTSTGPPPVLFAPVNGSTGASRTPTLTWSVAAGATSYDVYLGTVNPPPFVTNVVTTNYSPSALVASTQYFWKVVAKNGGGSASSSVFSFTTGTSSFGTIAYTCDATILAVGGVCDALNNTIAGLYGSAFSNARANIYIKFGSTGLGQSVTSLNGISYSTFRNALIAVESDANDITAVTSSVPSLDPFGTDPVVITNASGRALGFSPGGGIKSDGATSCSLTSAGCYDSVITVSSSAQAAGQLFFRTGSITGSQFDFYSVVEHETDEVLGTASCAFVCNFSGTIYIAPADLFRYHSNGTRSLAAGNNNLCSASNTANACFSIDGVNMLQQYNNIVNGQDAGDWATTCSHVQDAVGCLGLANGNISPSAEILVLDVVGFTTTPATLSATGVTPNAGTGSAQTFTGTYTATGGFQNLRWVQMLFAVATDGGGQSFCFVHYDVPGNSLWLFGDAGFFLGPVTPGANSNVLQNSLCAVKTSGSTVSGSGNTLTVNVSLVFKAAGARNIYLRAMDIGGNDTGPVQLGTWTMAAAALGTMTVSPATGSSTNGVSQTFTLTYPDPAGFTGSSAGWVQFLVDTASNGPPPFCFLHYDRAGNGLWMFSSDVGFFLGPVTPGTASSALNSSACSVNTAGTTVQNVSGNLVLTVPITLKAPMVGAKKTFQRALDVLNRDTGFVQSGIWTVN